MHIYQRKNFGLSTPSLDGVIYPKRIIGASGPVPPFNPYPNAIITLHPELFVPALFVNNVGQMDCGAVEWDGEAFPGIDQYNYGIPANLNLTYPEFLEYDKNQSEDYIAATGAVLNARYNFITTRPTPPDSFDNVYVWDNNADLVATLDMVLSNEIPLPPSALTGSLALGSGDITHTLYVGTSLVCGIGNERSIEIRLPQYVISVSYL